MSNIIDSIRLSGTTYQIQGSGGGITVDPTLDSGSTNPVANSAITAALDDKVNVVDNEVPDYNVTSQITYQGGYPSQSETASTWDDASMFTLRYNYIRISEVNYTTTAAVIDPSNNITTGRVTVEESVGNPLPDYIDMSFSDNVYRFTAKEGYRIAHLDIYNDKWATWGYIREERVETVFEGGQSADVIKDVIEPTLINKQDQLVSGTNIKTINNTSILGSGNIDIQGGGKAIEAGRGIAITTGETADTVSFNLPISANTNNSVVMGGKIKSSFTNNGRDCLMVGSKLTTNNGSDCSLVVGYNSSINGDGSAVIGWSSKSVGDSSFAFGTNVSANTSHTFAAGYVTIANNNYEASFGKYNASNTGSTNANNTLFSVGNGTSESARHNAFEIRQNGDIYLTLDGQDVKLQDQLGGGGSSYTAGDGIDITNDVISVTGKVDTSTYNTYTAATDTALASKADTSAVTEVGDALTTHTANTTVHTTAAEKTSWNGAVTDIATVSGQVSTNTTNIATVSAATTANTTALGGLSLIKLTQAEYDALSPNYDSNTLYVIVN